METEEALSAKSLGEFRRKVLREYIDHMAADDPKTAAMATAVMEACDAVREGFEDIGAKLERIAVCLERLMK